MPKNFFGAMKPSKKKISGPDGGGGGNEVKNFMGLKKILKYND